MEFTEFDLLLDQLDGVVEERVDESGDRVDSPDDRAQIRQEVAQRPLSLRVLDHQRGQFVLKECAGHAGLAAHDRYHFSMLRYRKLVAMPNAVVPLHVSSRHDLDVVLEHRRSCKKNALVFFFG